MLQKKGGGAGVKGGDKGGKGGDKTTGKKGEHLALHSPGSLGLHCESETTNCFFYVFRG